MNGRSTLAQLSMYFPWVQRAFQREWQLRRKIPIQAARIQICLHV
jgi:hypothetical protein